MFNFHYHATASGKKINCRNQGKAGSTSLAMVSSPMLCSDKALPWSTARHRLLRCSGCKEVSGQHFHAVWIFSVFTCWASALSGITVKVPMTLWVRVPSGIKYNFTAWGPKWMQPNKPKRAVLRKSLLSWIRLVSKKWQWFENMRGFFSSLVFWPWSCSY